MWSPLFRALRRPENVMPPEVTLLVAAPAKLHISGVDISDPSTSTQSVLRRCKKHVAWLKLPHAEVVTVTPVRTIVGAGSDLEDCHGQTDA